MCDLVHNSFSESLCITNLFALNRSNTKRLQFFSVDCGDCFLKKIVVYNIMPIKMSMIKMDACVCVEMIGPTSPKIMHKHGVIFFFCSLSSDGQCYWAKQLKEAHKSAMPFYTILLVPILHGQAFKRSIGAVNRRWINIWNKEKEHFFAVACTIYLFSF